MALVIGGNHYEDELDYHIQKHDSKDENILDPHAPNEGEFSDNPDRLTLDKNIVSPNTMMRNKDSIPSPGNVYDDAGNIVDFRNQNDDFNAMGKDLGLDHTNRMSNFDAANSDMNLNDQEKFLYQMHLSNLWGSGGVNNMDDNGNIASRSTLFQGVVEHNDSYYNIPTVWNGKKETEPYTRQDGTTFQAPNQTALDNVAATGWDKFPSYSTPEEADSRYDQMHSYMEKDTGQWFDAR